MFQPRVAWRRLLSFALIAAAFVGATPAAAPLPLPPRQPNFLLHFVDDLGYGDLGVTGHPTAHTPNIDALAGTFLSFFFYFFFIFFSPHLSRLVVPFLVPFPSPRRSAYNIFLRPSYPPPPPSDRPILHVNTTVTGRRLTSWYSGYPVCTASRTALLTGRHPPRVGMPGVINSLGVEGLPLSEITVADRLRALGYKTLTVGKWHQGQRPDYLPKARGFDAFYGLPYSVDDGIGYANASECGMPTKSCAAKHKHNNNNKKKEKKKKHSTKVSLGPEIPLPLIRQTPDSDEILQQPTDLIPLSQNMLAFVKNFTGQWTAGGLPWFAYVAHPHVHTATANVQQLGCFEQYSGCAFAGTSIRGGFGDALSEVDWMVGELVQHVEDIGATENTLVIFTSDNGPWLAKDQGGGSVGLFGATSAPYRNVGKGSTWEGGLRMPAFAYWPGTIPASTKAYGAVSSLDILPTLTSLAAPGGGAVALFGAGTVPLDGTDMTALLLGSADSVRVDTLLPFWNGLEYGKVGTDVYAGRWNQYKFHWITSTGLISGSHTLNHTVVHDPPLVFDVEQDPSEAYPLSEKSGELPAGLIDRVNRARKAHVDSFTTRAIDPRFGMQWALCCDRATNCTCDTPRNMPPEGPTKDFAAA
jgi:arylsulfatase A